MFTAGFLALFIEIELLAELVSIGAWGVGVGERGCKFQPKLNQTKLKGGESGS